MQGEDREVDLRNEVMDTTPPGVIVDLLEQVDVRLNGGRPWDIQVLDDRFYRKVLSSGSLGFGEAYMDGFWEARDLSELMTRLLRARLDEKPLGKARLFLLLHYLRARFFNLQSQARAFDVGKRHYDIGNDLYARMLDSNWCYSCGYWAEAEDLEAAQQANLELICRKLKLEPGMSVLDVGCGWGSLSAYMARHYGVRVHAITISREQSGLSWLITAMSVGCTIGWCRWACLSMWGTRTMPPTSRLWRSV